MVTWVTGIVHFEWFHFIYIWFLNIIPFVTLTKSFTARDHKLSVHPKHKKYLCMVLLAVKHHKLFFSLMQHNGPLLQQLQLIQSVAWWCQAQCIYRVPACRDAAKCNIILCYTTCLWHLVAFYTNKCLHLHDRYRLKRQKKGIKMKYSTGAGITLSVLVLVGCWYWIFFLDIQA